MLTCRAMRWIHSRSEPTRPWSPYHRAFPCQPLAALLTVPERRSADSLGASFLSFFCAYIYIHIFSILFLWDLGFELMSVVKQSENDLI
jgi:hypothetical protein